VWPRGSEPPVERGERSVRGGEGLRVTMGWGGGWELGGGRMTDAHISNVHENNTWLCGFGCKSRTRRLQVGLLVVRLSENKRG
jgi:hypothetical protein